MEGNSNDGDGNKCRSSQRIAQPEGEKERVVLTEK